VVVAATDRFGLPTVLPAVPPQCRSNWVRWRCDEADGPSRRRPHPKLKPPSRAPFEPGAAPTRQEQIWNSSGGTVNIRLYALRLYDTLSYNWESNYVQNRPFCHCGAGEKLFLVAARTFVAHLFLHGCACVGVIHKRISTVHRWPTTNVNGSSASRPSESTAYHPCMAPERAVVGRLSCPLRPELESQFGPSDPTDPTILAPSPRIPRF